MSWLSCLLRKLHCVTGLTGLSLFGSHFWIGFVGIFDVAVQLSANRICTGALLQPVLLSSKELVPNSTCTGSLNNSMIARLALALKHVLV